MLEKLALKHDLWVKMAKGICKDAYLADDLVSEMYLKMIEVDTNSEIKDGYIRKVIYNLFIDYLRENKRRKEVDLKDVFKTPEQKNHVDIELPDCVTWVEKQILLLRQEYSGREIAQQYHLHHVKVHRIEKQAKEKLKEWAKEKYKELEM